MSSRVWSNFSSFSIVSVVQLSLAAFIESSCSFLSRYRFKQVELFKVASFTVCWTRVGVLCYILLHVECALIFCGILFGVWNVLLCIVIIFYVCNALWYFVFYLCVWNSLWYFFVYIFACGTRSVILCWIFYVSNALWYYEITCYIYTCGTRSGISCYILSCFSLNYLLIYTYLDFL